MKLIIAGATGFVGTEVVRQALRSPNVTSIVALARKPIRIEDGVDAAKLKSVTIQDYGHYPDEVKKEFAGANACIWTVAVTPSKSSAMDFAEVKRICHDCTMAGLQAMYEAGPAKPFRFLYMSGHAAERDQTKTPSFKPEYSLMRGQTENEVLAFAAEHPGEVEACVAKPGLITAPGDIIKGMLSVGLKYIMGVPSVRTADVAAAMLHQVERGFEKEPLMSDDLTRIGQGVSKS